MSAATALAGIPVGARYPQAVREIHQIEPTSRCNLKCKYCPQWPKLPRAKLDMTQETFEAALAMVEYFVGLGTQTELSLTGIGEPTLHPHFVDMMVRAREVIGPDRKSVV